MIGCARLVTARKLLQFLDRADVTEIVVHTDKPVSAKVGGEYRPLSRSPVSGAQIAALVEGSSLAGMLPEKDGTTPQQRVVLLGKPYAVRAARRGEVIRLRFERAPAERPPTSRRRKPRGGEEHRERPPGTERSPTTEAKPPPTSRRRKPPVAEASERLRAILAQARERRASDAHIIAERPIQVRCAGELAPVGDPTPAAAVAEMLLGLLSHAHRRALEERGYVDLSAELPRPGGCA